MNARDEEFESVNYAYAGKVNANLYSSTYLFRLCVRLKLKSEPVQGVL